MTSVKEAAYETKHLCGLEKCIRTLVRQHVVPKTDERQAVKRPPDPVERLEQAKVEVTNTLMTQAGGPSRREITSDISALQEKIGGMAKRE